MGNNPIESVAKELLEVQRTLGWMDLVIGSIDDAVYVTDHENRVIFANQYFSDLLNIPRVFLLGQQIDDVFNIKYDERLSAETVSERADSRDEAAIYTWTIENDRRIFKISKKHIVTTKQVVHLAKDITHEQELTVMKNSFINIASHQLRTPMTSIMLNAHLLNDMKSDTADADSRAVAAALVRSSERMIRLISDILNITKIQNNAAVTVRSVPIDLRSICDTIYEDIKSDINAKKLRFNVTVRSDFKPFNSDPSALHEIIANLATNAVQYTPSGGSITIGAQHDKQSIVITVQDTGIGIPAKSLNQIYDQFSRADNAFEVFNEGTGLGLYLVKLLLGKIGGTIDCRSKLGRGTTFTIRLPNNY